MSAATGTVRVTVSGTARADSRRAWHCARASFHGADAVCVGFYRGSVCPPYGDPNDLTYVFVPRPGDRRHLDV